MANERPGIGATRMMPSNDEQLVKACLAGNEQAWSALLDKYKNLIYSIPVKAGFSRDDAGEIFQQVCMKLLSDLPSIRDPNCIGAWLIKVTSHNCFHWTRRERTQEKHTLHSEYTEQADAQLLPEEHLLDLEREQMVREALLGINPRCRDLIRMLFYESPPRPYDEVAKSLNLATGSIGFIRMRCLKQLRIRLKEKGFR